MVNVIGLGGRKEDFLNAALAQEAHETPDPARAKRGENISHDPAQVFDRFRAGMDRAQRIYEHDLAVDTRKVIAEERTHDLAFIGLISALKFARDGAARRMPFRQGGKGQNRRAIKRPGQQETARRAVGKPRGPCGVEIRCIALRQRFCRWFIEFCGAVKAIQSGKEFSRLRPRARGAQRLRRPFSIGFFHQRQIEQPFAGIVDDIQMHGFGA